MMAYAVPGPFAGRGDPTPPQAPGSMPHMCCHCRGAASPTPRKIPRMGNTPKNHLAAGTGTAPAFCVKFGKEGGG